jgi:hypothetical protein
VWGGTKAKAGSEAAEPAPDPTNRSQPPSHPPRPAIDLGPLTAQEAKRWLVVRKRLTNPRLRWAPCMWPCGRAAVPLRCETCRPWREGPLPILWSWIGGDFSTPCTHTKLCVFYYG